MSFSDMAGTCPSDTELEEVEELNSTIDLCSENVEKIGELGEEKDCHEKSEEDWESKAFEDGEDCLDIDIINTDYFIRDHFNRGNSEIENRNVEDIEAGISKRLSLLKQEDRYKFTQEDTVVSQLSDLTLHPNESSQEYKKSPQIKKEEMRHAGKSYKEEELGCESTAQNVFSKEEIKKLEKSSSNVIFKKEVSIILIWDVKDITKRTKGKKIRSGDIWNSVSCEDVLLDVEAQVRNLPCCRDSSKKMFLRLQEKGKEDSSFSVTPPSAAWAAKVTR